jgi:hypothetical protein
MRKTLVSVLAGSLIAAGALAGVAAPSATAADNPGLLGTIVPGSLDQLGGLANFAKGLGSGVSADDLAAVQAVPTGAAAAAVSVTPATGQVSVAGSCGTQYDVGFAVGSATSTFTLTLPAFTISLGDNAAALGFTIEEALSVVPPITFTMHDPANGDGTYTADLTEETVTPNPGNIELDGLVRAYKDDLIVAIGEEIGAAIQEGLNVGLAQTIEDILWEGTFTRDLSYSFAQAFAGTLTSGSATVDPQGLAKGTWLGDFAGKGAVTATPIKDLTWRDLVPASVVTALEGTLGAETLDAINIQEEAWPQMQATLNGQIGFVLTKAAQQLVAGINEGMSQINGTVPFPDLSDEITVDMTSFGTEEQLEIQNRLKGMTTAKVNGPWQQAIIDNATLTGSVTRTVKYLGIDTLQATGVTGGAFPATLTVPAVSVTTEGTAKLAPAGEGPSGVTPTYTFTSSDPSIATVAADGTVTGVAAGTTKVSVTAEYACSADDKLVQTGAAEVTVNASFADVLREVLARVKAMIERLLAIFAGL